MNDRSQYKPVATAVRVEYNPESDDLYLVFHVIDDNLKRRIKNNWTQDIDLKIIGRKLIEVKE